MKKTKADIFHTTHKNQLKVYKNMQELYDAKNLKQNILANQTVKLLEENA